MDNNQKTLVIGASEKPDRYSNMAIRLLLKKGKQVVAIGSRTGQIEGVFIQEGLPNFEDIHTITLYINPEIQKKYYEYILALQPKRIIFNPGTENRALKEMAESAGIKTEEACTLVLLNLNLY
jgi:predicted CoA-binding protein